MTRDAEAGIEGRIALVTGGARGIGAAVVEALARAGAVVAAVDIDEERLREVAARDYGAGPGPVPAAVASNGGAVAAAAPGSVAAGASESRAGGRLSESALARASAGGDIARNSGDVPAGGVTSGGDSARLSADSAAGARPGRGAAQTGAEAARARAEFGAELPVSAELSVDAELPVDAALPVGARAGRVVPFVADVGDPRAVARVVADVERELGPIGIGVSVAGVLRPGSVGETSDEDWAATFAVNSTGVFTVLREISRRMQPRGSGALVTVGSNAAGVPRTGMAAYAASKASATMLTRCLGLELAGSGIRCNIVSPGSTDTDMQRLLWTDDSGEARVIAGNPEQFRVGIPLGRIADPADIADAVLFLASDRARHITMQNLYVDGGATLRA